MLLSQHTGVTYELFKQALLYNLEQKSSTSKGQGSTHVSPLKLPLLLSGQLLQVTTVINAENVCGTIWDDVDSLSNFSKFASWYAFSKWFDELQSGLIAYEGYKLKRQELGIMSQDRRYRIWEVKYHPNNPKPGKIHDRLLAYHKELENRIAHFKITGGESDLVKLLAWADREFDFMIHPYLDGCGRMATAIVMWLAAGFSPVLPRFAPKKEHYAAMQNELTYNEYMAKCLEQGFRI